MSAPIPVPTSTAGFSPETLMLMEALQNNRSSQPKPGDNTAKYVFGGLFIVAAAGVGYWYWKEKKDADKKKAAGKPYYNV